MTTFEYRCISERADNATAALNTLGAHGWELVTALSWTVYSVQWWTFWLKRVRDEKA